MLLLTLGPIRCKQEFKLASLILFSTMVLTKNEAFYETKKKTLDNYFNNNYDDTIDFIYDVLVRDIGLEYELRQTV